MCVMKKPKISSAASQEKPVQVFTNKYFVARGEDALAKRTARNSLVIRRKAPTVSTGLQA